MIDTISSAGQTWIAAPNSIVAYDGEAIVESPFEDLIRTRTRKLNLENLKIPSDQFKFDPALSNREVISLTDALQFLKNSNAPSLRNVIDSLNKNPQVQMTITSPHSELAEALAAKKSIIQERLTEIANTESGAMNLIEKTQSGFEGYAVMWVGERHDVIWVLNNELTDLANRIDDIDNELYDPDTGLMSLQPSDGGVAGHVQTQIMFALLDGIGSTIIQLADDTFGESDSYGEAAANLREGLGDKDFHGLLALTIDELLPQFTSSYTKNISIDSLYFDDLQSAETSKAWMDEQIKALTLKDVLSISVVEVVPGSGQYKLELSL